MNNCHLCFYVNKVQKLSTTFIANRTKRRSKSNRTSQILQHITKTICKTKPRTLYQASPIKSWLKRRRTIGPLCCRICSPPKTTSAVIRVDNPLGIARDGFWCRVLISLRYCCLCYIVTCLVSIQWCCGRSRVVGLLLGGRFGCLLPGLQRML